MEAIRLMVHGLDLPYLLFLLAAISKLLYIFYAFHQPGISFTYLHQSHDPQSQITYTLNKIELRFLTYHIK